TYHLALGLMASIGALGVFQFMHRNDVATTTVTTVAATITTVSNLTSHLTTLAPTIGPTVSNATTFASTTVAPAASCESTSILPIIFITIFVSALSLGVGPICWIIITEITPPQTIGLISSPS